MKNLKKIAPLILCLSAMPGMAVRAYAVWPPSTMLAEASAPAPITNSSESLSETSKHAQEIVDKLDADERRLQAVLQAIEEDKKKLKEQDNGHSVR